MLYLKIQYYRKRNLMCKSKKIALSFTEIPESSYVQQGVVFVFTRHTSAYARKAELKYKRDEPPMNANIRYLHLKNRSRRLETNIANVLQNFERKSSKKKLNEGTRPI